MSWWTRHKLEDVVVQLAHDLRKVADLHEELSFLEHDIAGYDEKLKTASEEDSVALQHDREVYRRIHERLQLLLVEMK